MLTTVIKVKGRDRDRLLADPNFVYVGRAFAGFEGSIWANPFRPSDGVQKAMNIFLAIPFEDLTDFDGLNFTQSLAEMNAVQRYEFYLKSRRSLMDRIPELCGKSLGCWCTTWDGTGNPETVCHAMVLAGLANAMEAR